MRLPTADDLGLNIPNANTGIVSVTPDSMQGLSAIGNAMGGIYEDLERQQQVKNQKITALQKAKADTQFLQQSNEFMKSLNERDDYNNFDRDAENFSKGLANISASISDPYERELYNENLAVAYEGIKQKVSAIKSEKWKNAELTNFLQFKNYAMDNVDNSTIGVNTLAHNRFTEGLVAIGAMTPLQKDSHDKQFNEDINEKVIWTKAQNDPDGALQDLGETGGANFQNFDSIMNFVHNVEGSNNKTGGFVSNDGGAGPTIMGINSKANPHAYSRVKELWDNNDKEGARLAANELYKTAYWDEIGGENLPAQLQLVAMDAAVNMGVQTAKKLLQEAGNDPVKFTELRKEYYKNIVASKPEKARYLNGWLSRSDNALKDSVSIKGSPLSVEKTISLVKKIKKQKQDKLLAIVDTALASGNVNVLDSLKEQILASDLKNKRELASRTDAAKVRSFEASARIGDDEATRKAFQELVTTMGITDPAQINRLSKSFVNVDKTQKKAAESQNIINTAPLLSNQQDRNNVFAPFADTLTNLPPEQMPSAIVDMITTQTKGFPSRLNNYFLNAISEGSLEQKHQAALMLGEIAQRGMADSQNYFVGSNEKIKDFYSAFNANVKIGANPSDAAFNAAQQINPTDKVIEDRTKRFDGLKTKLSQKGESFFTTELLGDLNGSWFGNDLVDTQQSTLGGKTIYQGKEFEKMQLDYNEYLRAGFLTFGNIEQAKEKARDALLRDWRPSAANNGKLMKNSPEILFNLSSDYVQNKMENLNTVLGKSDLKLIYLGNKNDGAEYAVQDETGKPVFDKNGYPVFERFDRKDTFLFSEQKRTMMRFGVSDEKSLKIKQEQIKEDANKLQEDFENYRSNVEKFKQADPYGIGVQ